MPASLVCSGAVLSGLLQVNGRKLVTGAVPVASLASLSGEPATPSGTHVEFGPNVTLPAGFSFTFASQPGVAYELAAPIVDDTSGTLTQTYTGPPGATVARGLVNALFNTGPNRFTCDAPQTLPTGFQFQIAGTGQVYTTTAPVVASAVISSFTPATGLPGDGSSVTLTAAVPSSTKVLTLPGPAATDASKVAVLLLVQTNGEPARVEATPWATLLATPGATVLACPGGTFECMGADRQPVTLVSAFANALTP